MTRGLIEGAEGRSRPRPRRRGVPAAAVVPAMVALLALAPCPARSEAGPAATPAPVGRGVLSDPLRPSFDIEPARETPAAAVEATPVQPAVPTIPLPGSWPAVEVRTILVGFHLLGLCFGLGGATMLDFWLLRWMRWGYLPDNVVRTFEFVGKVVLAGLALLWLSGGGFVLTYALYDPAKLANPKILAKLVIVVALSVNGIVIHRLILPYVAQVRAMPLFDGVRRRRRTSFILSGALSGVSWYSAFALGLLHEFNGRVPALTILGLWLMLVLLSTAALELLLIVAPATRLRRAAEGDAVG